jgi:methionyl-tRNA synthetase
MADDSTTRPGSSSAEGARAAAEGAAHRPGEGAAPPRERRYLTTPIYYATGEPHIGHAYTTLLADTLARYHRQAGRDVLFLTGTDEHGQKIQEEAARREITPIELCDEMAKRFVSAWERLDVSYDRFIRTTEQEHIAVVQAFLERLKARDLIYDAQYRGWYCVHEERYWTEKDLGPERNCPDCGRPVREIEEKNYFFRMSGFQQALLRHIQQNPEWIFPESRRNEVVGFLQKPLEDLSISRPRSRLQWGVPLPWDDEHVTYVWVDALVNYVTASGVIDPERPQEAAVDSWWPADLHLLGKDILTTHAVYWPTLLLGAGLPLPRRLLSHGWWVVGETKMSKSLGNVVDPLALEAEFGADAVRWYLLREMPTGGDASYTPERFAARYEELANILGNLASRVVSMVDRYRGGSVSGISGDGLREACDAAIARFTEAMEGLRIHEALAAAMELARTANGYVEEREPWAQAKDESRAAELDETLASLLRALAVASSLLAPVMPTRMDELARRLGLEGPPTFAALPALEVQGLRVQKGAPLFPRQDAGKNLT